MIRKYILTPIDYVAVFILIGCSAIGIMALLYILVSGIYDAIMTATHDSDYQGFLIVGAIAGGWIWMRWKELNMTPDQLDKHLANRSRKPVERV